MKTIDLYYTTHNFKKSNLVTKIKRHSTYDEYKCSLCGAIGKRHGLSENITITDKTPINCPKYTKIPRFQKWIKIIHCYAAGKPFENLEPNSIHLIIPAPLPYEDDLKGVWVMGNGEPVKVLNNEFKQTKITRL